MGQILHGCTTTTEAVHDSEAALQRKTWLSSWFFTFNSESCDAGFSSRIGANVDLLSALF